MHKFRLLFVILFILFGTLNASAAELKVAVSTWPPYSEAELPGGGLAMNIVTTALKRAGYTLKLIPGTWQRNLQGTNIGIYDVLPAVWHTEQRAEAFTFSKPYLQTRVKFIKRKESKFTFNSLDDLKGKIVGVVKNYAYGQEFNDADNLIKVSSNHVIQNLLLLQRRKIDLTLGDERVLRHEINKYMPANNDKFVFLPKPLSVKGLHIAVSKKNPDSAKIAAAFNKAIAAMQADGSYQKILDLY